MAGVPEVPLTPRGTARLKSGHPWIHRGDVAGAAPPGADEVRVLDERRRPLGSALWAPEPAPIALRVYARGPAHAPLDEVLPARLLAAAARRAELAPGAEACRLVHAEADLLPGLFVDRYGDAAVIQTATAAMDRREAAVAQQER